MVSPSGLTLPRTPELPKAWLRLSLRQGRQNHSIPQKKRTTYYKDDYEMTDPIHICMQTVAMHIHGHNFACSMLEQRAGNDWLFLSLVMLLPLDFCSETQGAR